MPLSAMGRLRRVSGNLEGRPTFGLQGCSYPCLNAEYVTSGRVALRGDVGSPVSFYIIAPVDQAEKGETAINQATRWRIFD
jgi:hypothetical protein